jgi:hypothetical protein
VAIAPHGFAEEAPTRLGTLGVAYDGSAESEAALEGGRRLARKAGAQLDRGGPSPVEFARQHDLALGGVTRQVGCRGCEMSSSGIDSTIILSHRARVTAKTAGALEQRSEARYGRSAPFAT